LIRQCHCCPVLCRAFLSLEGDRVHQAALAIGIFDLLTTAKTEIIDPALQSLSVEVYLFVGLIYFAFCFAMSRYSRSLEAQAGPT
jgi:general L-amino acid transport system permease protein